MPRKKKEQGEVPAPKTTKRENTLLSALQFVALAQTRKSEIPSYFHCRMWANKLSGCSAVLSAGIEIQELIECCPDTFKLIDALKECPESISLTFMPTLELLVKSGNFQAAIPCISQTDIPAIYPDLNTIDVPAEFQYALEKVSGVANEKAKQVAFASIYMAEGSVLATNGDVIVEAWHGCSTPIGLIVPKVWVSALRKVKGKSFYRLAASGDSLTAYYGDGSWIKTRLHLDLDFPRLQRFLDLPCNPIPTPLGFWAAIERLSPFATDGRIYFRPEGLCTDQYQRDGAINLCDGLPTNISFNIAALNLIAPFAEKLAFNVTNKMTYFFGKGVRGAIAHEYII